MSQSPHIQNLPNYPLQDLVPLKEGPFLGLDWGRKRCGLAISDPLRQFSMPLNVVKSGGVLRYTLVDLWKEVKAAALIIGWPLLTTEKFSPLNSSIQRLAYRLSQDHGWPIALVDETLSSHYAQDLYKKHYSPQSDILKSASKPSSLFPSAPVLDHIAAASILQGALDQWNTIRPYQP